MSLLAPLCPSVCYVFLPVVSMLTSEGMAKAVADTNIETQAGFASDDGNITGFSHMHDR